MVYKSLSVSLPKELTLISLGFLLHWRINRALMACFYGNLLVKEGLFCLSRDVQEINTLPL